ncbi:MAG: hypothetical protein CM1200mP38_4080 [Dehalococcoidia bacterium]|nr:MAG: hypothetical protein CM1200mP38_4080 [Dehalococcoidia bacterium]
MKGMRFPFDFIWIGNDCKVVDLTENVVVDTNQEELNIYNSSQPAEFNFEFNAGEIQLSNIQIGDIVQFKNIDVEGISCVKDDFSVKRNLIFMGTPSFVVPVLQSLSNFDWNIIVIQLRIVLLVEVKS